MFPADFAYARARSLDDAFDLLQEAQDAEEEAKLIAGGQSLLPMMKLRLAAPKPSSTSRISKTSRASRAGPHRPPAAT